MQLTSKDFHHEGDLPGRCTCQGLNRSPSLEWSGAPAGTRSFALIVDDPDAPDPAAPKLTWVHWVLYNVPASVARLDEGCDPPAGALVGLNDSKHLNYDGPCPPIGRHRYFHRLYALDAVLPDLGPGGRKVDLEHAMRGHVLAEAVLMGTYCKA